VGAGHAGRLGCPGAGRAQALERDLSSVRLCEGERAPMLRLGRPVGPEGERAGPDWRPGLAAAAKKGKASWPKLKREGEKFFLFLFCIN
jgi:hypothetical protein